MIAWGHVVDVMRNRSRAKYYQIYCWVQQWKNFSKNLAIAYRSRVSCAHNMLRASIGLN